MSGRVLVVVGEGSGYSPRMPHHATDNEAALLARICADPTDIEARLVYADSLSERGDPRGAFIAQHCQLEQLDALDDGYAPLAASTRRLEAAHAPGWIGDYLTLAKVERAGARIPIDRLLNAEFRHGFLYRIAMTPEDIATHWPWLREREPLQGIELRGGECLPEGQRDTPEAATFRCLKVCPDGWFAANSVGDVLRWGMAELRELDLSRCDLGLAGAQMLCNQPTDLGDYFDDWIAPPPLPAGQLRRLALHGATLGDAGVRLLFEAETTTGLEALDVSQNQLAEASTLEALAASPFEALRELNLAGNAELGGQLAALARWPRLPALEALALPKSVTAEDVAALFATPSPALRRLDLSGAKALCAGAIEAVAGCAEALTELDLGLTRVGDKKLPAVCESPSLRRVHRLKLNGCSLSDKSIEALVASPLEALLELDVSSNKLTDAGLAALAGWPGLRHVTHLRVGNNRKVTTAGYQALLASEHLEPVRFDIGKGAGAPLEALRERFGEALVTS